MSVDEDFESVLRDQFRAHEPRVTPPVDLATRVVVEGDRAVKRRRTRLGLCGAAGAAAVVVGVSVAATLTSSPGGDPAPGESTSPSADSSGSEGTSSLTAWGDGLPRGRAPEVAYLAGTTVYLPSGAVTQLEAEDAEIVGQTVAGLIVFVEDHNADGVLTGSRFVRVHDDGTTFAMQTPTLVAGGAREALVAPEGRYFTNGHQVVDKSTGAVVAEVPDEAQVMEAWTSAGVLYTARSQQYYLWRPGEEPIAVRGNPGAYVHGTDVGLREGRSGCTEVVRIDTAGVVRQLGSDCVPDLLSISPDGSEAVTTDLRVVDVETGETTNLSETPLDHLYGFLDVDWLDNDEFLVSVPASSDLGVLRAGRLRASGPVQHHRPGLRVRDRRGEHRGQRRCAAAVTWRTRRRVQQSLLVGVLAACLSATACSDPEGAPSGSDIELAIGTQPTAPTPMVAPTPPTPPAAPTDDAHLRELIGGTQARWDPRRVDHLPTVDPDDLLPRSSGHRGPRHR